MIKFSKNEILNLNNQYSENNSIICSTLRENCWDIFDSVSTILTESVVLPGNLEVYTYVFTYVCMYVLFMYYSTIYACTIYVCISICMYAYTYVSVHEGMIVYA